MEAQLEEALNDPTEARDEVSVETATPGLITSGRNWPISIVRSTMTGTMREVVAEYQDTGSVSEYASLADMDEY